MMQKSPPKTLKAKGYVTTWKSVKNKRPSQVERLLGFSANALYDGYWLYALTGKVVKLDDFEWKDRTIFADGWRSDPSIDLGDGKTWKVQVSDRLRAIFYKRSGYDETAAERMLVQFQNEQLELLNVRSGPGRIVKVIPAVQKLSGKYPDSKFKNIPQWKLKIEKKFVLIYISGPENRS